MRESESPRHLHLVAYQCGPGMGSVSQIGWEWYRRLSEKISHSTSFDGLTLYTSVRNRDALRQAGAEQMAGEIVYIDTEWFAAPLYSLMTRLFGSSEHAIFMFTSLDYFIFDRQVLRSLRAAKSRRGLIHLVTPVSALLPTRLGQAGLPLVIGPLNSGLPLQKNYPDIMRADFQWLYRIRHLARLPQLLFGSFRKAALIYVAMRHVRAALPESAQGKLQTLIENGVDPAMFRALPWPGEITADQPLQIIFVGRLVPVKALGLLLQAMARLRAEARPVRLSVVGDGGMRAAWEAQAKALGLADDVIFHGNLALSEIPPLIARAHALCLPSVRESGGAVILEAAAMARPSIVVDFGGPAELVNDQTGAVVSAEGPEQTIAGLVQAMHAIIMNPDAWKQRGLNAHALVMARYSWDAKIAAAFADYLRLV